MKKAVVCGLDIGSFKSCATCARVDQAGVMEILASLTVFSQGIRAGRITDQRNLVRCLRQLLQSLRRRQGLNIKKAYVNIDLLELKTNIYPGTRAFLHIPAVKILFSCLRQAGWGLEEFVPSGLAQSLGLFQVSGHEQRKERILIDIGAGLVKFSLLEAGRIKEIMLIPWGAQLISDDIARKLKLSLECAEKLKRDYGRLHSPEASAKQKIIIKDRANTRLIQPEQLNLIISANVDNLLLRVKNYLQQFDYQRRYECLYLTGGGAILEGFLERAEEVLQKPVKMGILRAVNDSHIQTQSALYSTSIGLIHFGYQHRLNRRLRPQAVNNSLSRMAGRAKQFYHEYFWPLGNTPCLKQFY